MWRSPGVMSSSQLAGSGSWARSRVLGATNAPIMVSSATRVPETLTTPSASAWTGTRTIASTGANDGVTSGSNDEPQLACGGPEALVEADKRALSRTLAAPDERCCQLHGVRSPQSVRVRQLFGKRSELFRWQDLVPRCSKLSQQIDGCHVLISADVAVSNEPGERAPGLQRRAPPNNHTLQVASKLASLCARRLRATERDDRARVPEGHRSDLVAIGRDGGDHRLQRYS